MQIVDSVDVPGDQTGVGLVVHPLSRSINAITSVAVESQNIHRFAVASNEYSSSNTILVVDFDEDSRRVSVSAQVESLNPVQHILDFHGDSEKLRLILSQKDISSQLSHVKVALLDRSEPCKLSVDATSPPFRGTLRAIAREQSTDKKGNARLAVVQPQSIALLTAELSGISVISTLTIGKGGTEDSLDSSSCLLRRSFYTGKFDPHHRDILGVAAADRFELFDVRQKPEELVSVRGGICHIGDVLDLDFNPNVPNELVTVGEDDKMVFWDLRATVKPLEVIASGHKNCTQYVRFNAFHDQLILTGGPSSTLMHLRESKVTQVVYQNIVPSRKASWSVTDAWHFAALSGNRLVLDQTPERVKYKLLL